MIIKVCGLREPGNISELSQLSIDWMGFIFHPKSQRYVERPAKLAAWLKTNAKALAAQKRVGVFVNAGLEEVGNVVRVFELDIVQLHGEEGPAFCEELKKFGQGVNARPVQVMKAFRVGADFDFSPLQAYEEHCDYFLFDTKGETHGGTGKKFDWSILEQYQGAVPFLLSGGIGPGDAEEVAAFQHPFCRGIDLNSRFESSPGLKKVEALDAFLNELKVH